MTLSGRILRANGNPINVVGAVCTVSVHRRAGDGPGRDYSVTADATGSWSTQVEPGEYDQPKATATIPFHNASFIYPLELAGASSRSMTLVAASHPAPVDFVWKVSGPEKRGNWGIRAESAMPHYGATCDISYLTRHDPAAVEKTLVINATPIGKGIDGSTPQPVVSRNKFQTRVSMLTTFGVIDLMPTEGGWSVGSHLELSDGTAQPPLYMMLAGTKPDDERNVTTDGEITVPVLPGLPADGRPCVMPLLAAGQRTP